MHINRDLWKHQKKLVSFALDCFEQDGYCFWLAGCATGKTIAAYELIAQLAFVNKVKKVLVITRKTIMRQAWLDDFSYVEGATLHILDKGTAGDKGIEILKDREGINIYVVNYETAALMKSFILAADFDMVIGDESHRLKSHDSKQSRDLALACKDIGYKLLMTGTAWDDRPTDVYGQVRFMDCDEGKRGAVHSYILGTWYNFFDKYVIYRTVDNIRIPLGYKNLPELNNVISPFTIRLETEDVLDLPKVIHIERKLSLTGELKNLYRDMRSDMLSTLNDTTMTADNALTQTLRLQQLTGGYFTADHNGGGKHVPTPKTDELLSILDEIGKHPVVIFTRFKTDVELLKPMLEKQGYKVKLLVGGTYEHTDFQNGDGDVLIANIQTGNAGITLTRARYCIYYSIGYSRTDYNQSLYRVRRPGSDMNHPITYYHILIEGTVDTLIRSAMESKRSVADVLLEGLRKAA